MNGLAVFCKLFNLHLTMSEKNLSPLGCLLLYCLMPLMFGCKMNNVGCVPIESTVWSDRGLNADFEVSDFIKVDGFWTDWGYVIYLENISSESVWLADDPVYFMQEFMRDVGDAESLCYGGGPCGLAEFYKLSELRSRSDENANPIRIIGIVRSSFKLDSIWKSNFDSEYNMIDYKVVYAFRVPSESEVWNLQVECSIPKSALKKLRHWGMQERSDLNVERKTDAP